MKWRKDPLPDPRRCSFCNKSVRDVARLISGPAVYICIECVEICNQIIAETKLLEPGEKAGPEAVPEAEGAADVPVRCGLCLMLWPRDRSTAFPDRGWLCGNCLDSVRLYLESSEGT